MVQQGDLTDPYYFDFISFAQYATIDREMKDPPIVFEEQVPTETENGTQIFVPRVIRRDSSISNEQLLFEHDKRVGEAIVQKFEDTFDSSLLGISNRCPSIDEVVRVLNKLVNLFVLNGFAFEGRAAVTKDPKGPLSAAGAQISITLTSPATLWSSRALQLRKANPTNDFVLKAARVILSRAGYTMETPSIKYADSVQISTFSLK